MYLVAGMFLYYKVLDKGHLGISCSLRSYSRNLYLIKYNKRFVMTKKKRTIKIIIGKTAMDGHWRGVQAIAAALRDAGMEVVYVGSLTADSIVQTAIQEDADVIGLNVGAGYKQIEELMRILKERDMEDVQVILGGTIPLVDIPRLKQMGVSEVFPPGSRISNIIKYIHENARVVDK